MNIRDQFSEKNTVQQCCRVYNTLNVSAQQGHHQALYKM
jgi:hypothetical protein